MTQEEICKFNKFGFCRFGNRCFRKHENGKCENAGCEIWECPFRHPRICSYYRDYKRCKFTVYCKFSHAVTNGETDTEEIEVIKKELESLRMQIMNKDKEVEQVKIEIEKLEKDSKERLLDFENINKLIIKDLEIVKKENETAKRNFEILRKDNETFKTDIEIVKKENETVKKGFEIVRKDNESVKEDLEIVKMDNEKVKKDLEIGKKENESMRCSLASIAKESVDRMENEKEIDNVESNARQEVNKNMEIQCDKCDFVGKSEAGLKIHSNAKHKINIMKMYRKL